MAKSGKKGGILSKVFRLGLRTQRRVRGDVNVYFISGMCYNCSVFDELTLPEGFVAKYIEWYVPQPHETLQHYARNMASAIDTSRPFVLVGYSFGAVVMQEMNRFLRPVKSVVISSFKSKDEIPTIFKAAKISKIAEYIPKELYESTGFITDAFNRFVYHTPTEKLAKYMTVVSPAYIKWAVEQIIDWVPDIKYDNLYHIHGTDDQIFPFEKIHNVFPVQGGDHLMVVRKAKEVSAILGSILLMK